ncbi:MAG TPA: glutamate formimidoyltransferase [Terriglobia bacterium]|nr:glutamate formimidoyltransferase [Terriglobia bacterium]
MKRIVECVPNFSEGRRPEVIDVIVAAMTAGRDVYLLDRQMDPDHNRAVITIAGAPESIGEAVIRGVETAAARIDLTRHQGGHPRIGAADVIPFIPLRGVSIEECVEIARQTGREIARRFHIPVYLYEAAATRPERLHIENIRRGQFEGLRDSIVHDPERKPDFGEPRVHPTAGATVVGARKPLIAYNINLHSADIEIAKRIAKRVRFSSGGFRHVKAIGLLPLDRNQAQVSMSLTDFERTSIELVFETVGREAERYGVSVAGSEIVGLIPQAALEGAAEFYLRLENFKSDMVLETRLDAAMSGVEEAAAAPGNADIVRPFVDRVASAEPVPAGGSAAALAGALGAALGQMTIEITKGKKAYQEHSARYSEALDRLGACRTTLLELIDIDVDAYRRVMSAYRLPKDSPERDKAIQAGLVAATESPFRTAACAAEALGALEPLRLIIYPNVASDFEVGLDMLRSCLRGAIANMRVNLAGLQDADARARYESPIAVWELLLSDR